MLPTIWKPQPKQHLFLENPAYECGFGGSKGPGKTDALIVDGSAQLLKPGYKAILFRRTYKTLEDIRIRTEKMFGHIARYDSENHCWIFPNKARFYLAHCQHEKDKENYQGQEYHWMGFDQLETFTESMYSYLKMQVRTTYPDIQCYIRSSFNPGGIGHNWVKQRFIDACPHDGRLVWFVKDGNEERRCSPKEKHALSRAFVFSTIFDNKHILDNDPMYLANLNSLPDKLKRAMRDGDWDAFEGQFFGEFDRSLHVISYLAYARIAGEQPNKHIASLDYGFAKPASVHFHAIFPDEDMITYKEIYGTGMTYEALAHKILQSAGYESSDGQERTPPYPLEYLVVDPAIQGDKSHHTEVKDGDMKGESGYDIIKRVVAGRFAVLLADNRRVIGWTRMHKYLEPYVDRFGQRTSKWRITDNCRNLIRTLPVLIFDSTNPEDVDSDGEDHAPDDCRYAIMSRQPLPDRVAPQQTKAEEYWTMVRKDIAREKTLKNVGQTTDLYNDMGEEGEYGRYIGE